MIERGALRSLAPIFCSEKPDVLLRVLFFSVACVIAPMSEIQPAGVHDMSATKNSFVRTASDDYSAPLTLDGWERPTSCCREKIFRVHEWSRRLLISTAQLHANESNPDLRSLHAGSCGSKSC